VEPAATDTTIKRVIASLMGHLPGIIVAYAVTANNFEVTV
jgi:hypothetical protein